MDYQSMIEAANTVDVQSTVSQCHMAVTHGLSVISNIISGVTNPTNMLVQNVDVITSTLSGDIPDITTKMQSVTDCMN